MKNQTDALKKRLTSLLKFGSRYSLLIFILVFSTMAGYLVMRIGNLARQEPTQFELDQRLQDIKRANANDDAVQALQSLQERNISIEALFDNGRTNPFED